MSPLPRRMALVISSLGSSLRGGGAAGAMSRLANHWAGHGRVVKFFVLAPPADRPFHPLLESIEVEWVDVAGPSGVMPHLTRIARRGRRLRAGFTRFRPDVIVSFLTGTNVNAIIAARGLGIPVAVSERVDPHHHQEAQPYRALRALAYPWADAVVVQTERAARFFPAALRSRIAIIPNSVLAHPTPKAQHAAQADSLLSIGRLDPLKDQVTVIEALARLKDTHPKLTLTIFGEGPEREALGRLIRARGLERRVSLPGFSARLSERLTCFDLFVHASRTDGFSNALAEAMSAGLPVIASDAAGNEALVQDGVNGRVFPVGDVAALVRTIGDLHGAPSTRSALAAAGRRVSETFSEDRIAALWDQVFAGVSR